jgi:hypothetical protein
VTALLDSCPEPFYSNCRNLIRRCRQCKAGPGASRILQYDPIEDLGDHPAFTDKAKSSQTRAGRKAENRTHQRLNAAIQKTQASGAKHGDGDFHILGRWRGEHKVRLTSRSITLSWTEYQKGLRQGISHWFLTVQKDKAHHFVIMTEESYAELLGLVHPTQAENPNEI